MGRIGYLCNHARIYACLSLSLSFHPLLSVCSCDGTLFGGTLFDGTLFELLALFMWLPYSFFPLFFSFSSLYFSHSLPGPPTPSASNITLTQPPPWPTYFQQLQPLRPRRDRNSQYTFHTHPLQDLHYGSRTAASTAPRTPTSSLSPADPIRRRQARFSRLLRLCLAQTTRLPTRSTPKGPPARVCHRARASRSVPTRRFSLLGLTPLSATSRRTHG